MVYRIVDPFSSALRDLQQALDATRRSDWFGRSTSGTGTYPAVNVFSKGDDCVVIAELPGVNKEGIDITVQDNQVRISGKREIHVDENVSVHRRERELGSFDRTLTMPIEVDADGVKAEYRDGILAVYLPRAESHKPRSVTIS